VFSLSLSLSLSCSLALSFFSLECFVDMVLSVGQRPININRTKVRFDIPRYLRMSEGQRARARASNILSRVLIWRRRSNERGAAIKISLERRWAISHAERRGGCKRPIRYPFETGSALHFRDS